MDDQLRPVDPAPMAGVVIANYQPECDALSGVSTLIARADSEFRAGCPIAARLEISKAMSALCAVFLGEAV